MIIEINNDCAQITQELKDGNKISKVVSFGELMSSLVDYQVTTFGLLPTNTRIMEFKGNSILIGIEFPAKKRSITYRKVKAVGSTHTKEISLPGGIFFAVLRKQVYSFLNFQSYIFATKGKITFSSDAIYRYPLPNIHSNGMVCWGSDFQPKLEKLLSVEGMCQEFFGGVFNSDLMFHLKHENIHQYLLSLEESQEYDSSLLKKNGHTVSSIIPILLEDAK